MAGGRGETGSKLLDFCVGLTTLLLDESLALYF